MRQLVASHKPHSITQSVHFTATTAQALQFVGNHRRQWLCMTVAATSTSRQANCDEFAGMGCALTIMVCALTDLSTTSIF